MCAYLMSGRLCGLKPMEEKYLNDHVRFLQDTDVTAYLRIGIPNLEGQRAWLQRVLTSSREELFAIFARQVESDLFIGVIHLRDVDNESGTAHSGMVIGDKRFWGRGIGTEAKHFQLKYAFEEMGLRWVYSRTASGNVRARRMLENTGYVRQGIRPSCRLVNGRYQDEFLYGASPASWRPRWEAFCSRS